MGKNRKNQIDNSERAGTDGLSKVFSLSSYKPDKNINYEAQVMAALMLQSNALVSIKTAVKLCSISRQEIDRRIHSGTFPKPLKLSGDKKAIRKAFRIRDIMKWLDSPSEYYSPNLKTSDLQNQHS